MLLFTWPPNRRWKAHPVSCQAPFCLFAVGVVDPNPCAHPPAESRFSGQETRTKSHPELFFPKKAPYSPVTRRSAPRSALYPYQGVRVSQWLVARFRSIAARATRSGLRLGRSSQTRGRGFWFGRRSALWRRISYLCAQQTRYRQRDEVTIVLNKFHSYNHEKN